MATYPGGTKTYTNKVDGTDIVQAADINNVQAEITAIETELGANPRTSALPTTAGTYNGSSPSFTTVSDRIKNLEAAVSGDDTNGTRVGYTLLYSGNFTSAPGALSVTGAGYVKFVIVVRVTTPGALTSITLSANGATTVKYGYFNYTTAVPSAGGGSLTGGAFPISNGVSPVANDTITAELYNVSATGAKTATWVNGTGFGSGIATAGGTILTNAINSITLAASTYATTATYSIYGVK